MKQSLLRFLLAFLCILLVIPENATSQGQDQSEKSIDEQINETIGPWADAVSNIIFYPIPIKPPIKAEFGGEVVSIDRSGRDFNYAVIESDDGQRKEYEIPAPKGQVIEEGQTLKAGDPISQEMIEVPIVVAWLILGGLIFTIGFKFVNIRKFKLALDVVRGKYTDPEESGEVSHFQALTAALSATVGLGNIAGVAIAISIGGPGATFWMILAGLLGMSTKFVECTLGTQYREIDEQGIVHGGPMYYLSRGLKQRNMGWLGKFLAVFFSIMCIGASFGGGNMFQVNQAYSQFSENLINFPGWIFGLIMASLVAIVIIGGIKSIARVTEKIVPFMTGVYFLSALFIILSLYHEIPDAFMAIVNGATDSKAIYGGIVGVLIVGFQRAAFSNEAGIGSAPIAHSAVKTNNPASEGLVALLEPFIDTIIVCTMTALVIIITDNFHYQEGVEGVKLTSKAFGTVLTWFPYLLSFAVILFAFSTMISWSYYGLQGWTFLFGKSMIADLSYKSLFCAFVVVGAAMNLGKVFLFSDAMIFAMCFPNLIGLYILAPEANRILKGYIDKIRRGEIIRR